MIGQIVNYRYEVLEKVGEGALSFVYKARDKVLNRLVALKVFRKEVAEDRIFSAALCAGYEDVATLAHPNITRVLEVDNSSEFCYIASDFAHGINVKDRIRRGGPISVPLALDIIIPVLEGLEYAHANKIIHGDIRPQDIIVSPDGEVKLTDFGLSYAMRERPEVADKYIMRSVQYQAPEVTEGVPTSISSDLYSIGIVLYEMLTGILPFDGSTAVSVALKKIKELPNPPRSVNASIPKSLNDLIMRAIEKLPEDRYTSASAMLLDLRTIRESFRTGHVTSVSQPIHARPVHEEAASAEPAEDGLKKWYVLLLMIFIVVVLIISGATYFLIGQNGDIRVPPLLGKTWEEAQYEADEKGIRLVDDGRVYSNAYEAGKICSVIPPSGSTVLRSDPVVKVKISQGPSRVMIPDLTGLPEASASETAVGAGFTIGKVTEEYSDKVPINAVISQTPDAGVIRPPGSRIDLKLSLGAKPESIPSESTEQPNDSSTKNQNRFNVAVEVPSDAEGAQEVRIVVDDERGETTPYKEMHQAGDRFTVKVNTQGSSPRIRVYVDDSVVTDETY